MSKTTDDFIGAIIESNIWDKAGITAKKAAPAPITEAAVPTTPAKEVEKEVHMCPLCESQLDSPLDKENVELFVEALLADDDEEVIAEDVDESEDEDSEDE